MRTRVRRHRSESGQIFVWAAVLLPIMLVAAGLTFDVGNMVNVRDELWQGVDAAALAATESIQDPNVTETKIRQAAQTVAGKNTLASLGKKQKDAFTVSLGLNAGNTAGGDIVLGNYDFTARTFTRAATVDVSAINAVQINAKLSTSAGVLPLAFGNIMGISSFDSTRQAIAAMGAPLKAKPTAPIAVDKGIFTGKRRGFTSPDDVVVSTKDPANAYWTGFLGGANASAVKNLVENPDDIPSLTVNVDKISLAKGNMTADYQAMKKAWKPGDDIIIPVVNTDADGAYGLVVGFAILEINSIEDSGNPKYLAAQLLSKKMVGFGDQATLGECFGFNCRAFLVY